MPYISAQTAVTVGNEMLTNNAEIDSVIHLLVNMGFPKSVCSIIISRLDGYSYETAKKIVLNSDAWNDCFSTGDL